MLVRSLASSRVTVCFHNLYILPIPDDCPQGVRYGVAVAIQQNNASPKGGGFNPRKNNLLDI